MVLLATIEVKPVPSLQIVSPSRAARPFRHFQRAFREHRDASITIALMTDALLSELQALERELHGPARGDRARLDDLLHLDFVEVGRSGRRYARADVLEAIAPSARGRIVADQFEARELQVGVVLLTYRSADVRDDDTREREAWRTSVWQSVEGRWRIRFHQGTPC